MLTDSYSWTGFLQLLWSKWFQSKQGRIHIPHFSSLPSPFTLIHIQKSSRSSTLNVLVWSKMSGETGEGLFCNSNCKTDKKELCRIIWWELFDFALLIFPMKWWGGDTHSFCRLTLPALCHTLVVSENWPQEDEPKNLMLILEELTQHKHWGHLLVWHMHSNKCVCMCRCTCVWLAHTSLTVLYSSRGASAAN